MLTSSILSNTNPLISLVVVKSSLLLVNNPVYKTTFFIVSIYIIVPLPIYVIYNIKIISKY